MIWTLLPLHIEVVLVGWIVQLAMGVVYWMSRGNVALVVSVLVLYLWPRIKPAGSNPPKEISQ